MNELAHVAGPPTADDPAIGGRPLTLPALLTEAAARHGDRDALVTPVRRITYRQLVDAATLVSRTLTEMGLRPGERVAVLAPNSPEFVAALFGIARAGSPAVLVNSLGSADDVRRMLDVAHCGYLLYCPSGRDLDSDRVAETTRVEGASRQLVRLAELLARPAPEGEREPASNERAAEVGADSDAVVLFTSGTTGAPKGVVHRHRAVCIQAYRWASLHGLEPGARMFSTAPLFWSSGLVKSLGAALVSGATLVTTAHFDPAEVLTLLGTEAVDTVILPPHLDRRLVEHPDFARAELGSIRRVHERNRSHHVLGLTEIWNPGGYGLSEACTLVASYPATTSLAALDGSCGPVVSGAEVRIADPDSGSTIGVGEVGRIWVGGETLMRGYLNGPAEYDEHGLLATSDLGHLDERGRLYFDGRMDSVVKSAGVNVSPLEVEQALAGYSRLAVGVVVALPHPTLGSALVLCASPAEDDVTEAEVRDFLRTRLAKYKLPRRIVLVPPDRLPLTATQKVDLASARITAAMWLHGEVDPEWRRTLEHAFPAIGTPGATEGGESPGRSGP